MLLVLPLSHVDAWQAFDLCEAIRRLDMQNDPKGIHDALVVTRPASESAARILADLYRPIYRNVSVFVLSHDTFNTSWPIGPNSMGYETMAHIHQNRLGEAFYWMEADHIPLKSGWLDTLEDEYKKCGKTHMGVKVESGDGTHINGAMITKTDWVEHPKYKAAILQPLALDYFARKEILADAHHTNLIQLNYNTVNYRRENGKIVCDTNGHDRKEFAQPIRDDAVVVHGCKDGSLKRLPYK